MKLQRFRAENFRNVQSCDLSFDDGVTVLTGENAQGKTNVVEGIYLFSRGKSFRARTEKELLKFGEEGFRLTLDYTSSGENNQISYSVFGNERRRMKNGYRLSCAAEMIGHFRAVLFCPDHLGLVKNGPDVRREFLNVGISAFDRAYIGYYADYKHALEERNCLLKFFQKGIGADMGELRAWSESVANYASYIYLARRAYVKKLEFFAKDVLSGISGGEEKLSLSYESGFSEKIEDREEVKAKYIELLTKDLSREIAAGSTLFGPARDDLAIKIGDTDARLFASQGQQRSVVLAMKHAEGEILRDVTGEEPVYLYDDVLSELDEKRRAFLLGGAGNKQIVMTSTGISDVGRIASHVIHVSEGNYVSSYR